MSKAEFD